MGLEFIDVTFPQQEKKLEKICKLFQKIGQYNQLGSLPLVQQEDLKLIKAAQDFAMYTRLLPANTADLKFNRTKAEIYKETFKIKVEITPEGWVKVTMPPMLPNKSKLSPWFLREPLNFALEEFFFDFQDRHDGRIFRIQRAIIIFKHRYDRKFPERDYCDLDNIETAAIQDSIAMFTMPDDNAKCCHIFSCMEPADSEFTEIFVIPQTEFSAWLAQYYKPSI